MKRMTWLYVGSMLLIGSRAMAGDSTFEDHLTSTTMVSPAQIYQVEDLRTDFNLGYESTEGSSKATGVDKQTNTATGTDLFAGAIYNVKAMDLRAGMTVNYGTIAAEMPSPLDASDKLKVDNTLMTFSPTVSYSAGPVVVGAAYDITQQESKADVADSDTMKDSYTTFRPGALFHNKDLEAGVTYASATNTTGNAEDKEAGVTIPATVTMHGRYALDSNMMAGAIVRNVHWQGINDDFYKDQTQIKGTGAYKTGPMKFEGDLGYNTAFYKDKDVGMSEGTIGTIAMGAAADYAVNTNTAVGGGLGYEFGSDKNDAAKVEANTLSLAVRGNMKF